HPPAAAAGRRECQWPRPHLPDTRLVAIAVAALRKNKPTHGNGWACRANNPGALTPVPEAFMTATDEHAADAKKKKHGHPPDRTRESIETIVFVVVLVLLLKL